MDGWSPDYPIPVSDDHLTNAPTTGGTESKKSRDEMKNSHPDVIDNSLKNENKVMTIIFILFRESYEILNIIIENENMPG